MRCKQVCIIVACATLLLACSSKHVPAPVEEIGPARTFKEFEQRQQYQVQPGDTLFSIAWYAGKDYRDIARLNNIQSPFQIFPGQQLWLSGKPTSSASSRSKSGQTTKTKPSVDPPKKQAYGEDQAVVKAPKSVSSKEFPDAVGRWAWPNNGKVISKYSLTENGNKGIDIAGQRGATIMAAAPGKVVYTGDALRGFGNLVIIKHTDAYLSAYAHNDEILVKEQQWVDTGQTIARMGDSGAQRVMLHFEIRYKGKTVDPLRYLPSVR